VYFLGIDPSATSSGLALIDRNGEIVFTKTIKTKSRRLGDRLAFIRDFFVAEIRRYLPVIKYAVIEAPAYDKPQQADLLGQVRGIFLLMCYDRNIPVLLVAPTSVKKFATGTGSAEKETMVKAAQAQWSSWEGSSKKDDEADALWMAEIARGTEFITGRPRHQLEVLHQLKHLEVEEDV
jgi:Holliday junction resolvasome RuvABC endonuclease subunit